MDRRIDVIVAAAFTVFGVLMIVSATFIKEGMMRDPIGPRAAFYVCGGIMALGGLWVIVGHLRRWSQQAQHLVRNEGVADEIEYPASALRAWGLVALCVVYAAMLEIGGFLIMTPLFLIAALKLLGKRNWGPVLIIAFLFTGITYVVFANALGVRIPVGPLTGLFRQLGWINL